MLNTLLLKPPELSRTLHSEIETWTDEFLPEEVFLRGLTIERKRSERSHRRFVLLLLESRRLVKAGSQTVTFRDILRVLFQSTRETDVKGWYRSGTTIGVIFTEIGSADGMAVANALLQKITHALGSALPIEQIEEIRLSFHVFPERFEGDDHDRLRDSTLYPDLRSEADSHRAGARTLKRTIDVLGSAAALVMLSPVLFGVAVLVKFTSKGPVLFRQKRIGLHGQPFTFFKFRSMYVDSDSSIHREYVELFISGKNGKRQEETEDQAVYKLTKDPRITSIGCFLRRTSLDELPQFWNVLKGDMSLVGPRPPVSYEFQCYDVWHRQRVLGVKPGITGPWQVDGRSRVKFDDMVRMDLNYARSWSLWGDLKLLFRTPAAVFSGRGAC